MPLLCLKLVQNVCIWESISDKAKKTPLNSNYSHLFYFLSIMYAGFNLWPYNIVQVTVNIFLC